MDKFRRHTGIAAPLTRANVDTDAIIPSREMKRVSKSGLGDGLFAGWRYRYEGGRRVGNNDDFVLNSPEYSGASILLGGANFGCGSSREHAVWALVDYGIRAIVAPSFGAIFKRNCYRNGLLPVELPAATVDRLVAAIAAGPQTNPLTIDLEAREVSTPDGGRWPFDVPDAVRERLLAGLDEIDLTLTHAGEIRAFRSRHRATMPWVSLQAPARQEH